MDSSKATFADLRHRALTHNSWFVTTVLEAVFGTSIINSEDRQVPVREIGQFHVMEDFKGSYPSASDFLNAIVLASWMDNGRDGTVPPSSEGLPRVNQDWLYMKGEYADRVIEVEDGGGRGCGGEGRMD